MNQASAFDGRFLANLLDGVCVDDVLLPITTVPATFRKTCKVVHNAIQNGVGFSKQKCDLFMVLLPNFRSRLPSQGLHKGLRIS